MIDPVVELAQHCPYADNCLTKFAVDHAADAALWMDSQGAFLYANESACRLLGYSTPELLARDIHEVAPEVAAHFGESTSEPTIFETTCMRRDRRSVPVEVTLTVVEGGGRRFPCAFLREISERQQLELQLRQAHKMEAVGRLVDGVAHDFNNVLTAVMIYSGLLLNQLSLQSPLRQQANQIVVAAEHGRALIGQLLGFGRPRIAAAAMVPVSLGELLGSMSEMLQRLLGEDVNLLVDCAPDLETVRGDRAQLEQVIMNLALNARDAMPEGGELSIQVSNFTVDKTFARKRPGLSLGEYVRLKVSDNGCGMDAETLSHAFEPFFTTKTRGRGTGLGLTTVYRSVRQAGGHIEMESQPGKGTTVVILLPCAVKPSVTLPPPRLETELRGTETVLLVEDDDLVRRSVREILTRRGYQVLEARQAREATRVAAQYPRPIHLMLVDLVLPGMSGSELAQRMQETRPEMRVLYMSGYSEDARVQQLTASGKPFCRKPFTAAVLSRKLREVLGGQQAAAASAK